MCDQRKYTIRKELEFLIIRNNINKKLEKLSEKEKELWFKEFTDANGNINLSWELKKWLLKTQTYLQI